MTVVDKQNMSNTFTSSYFKYKVILAQTVNRGKYVLVSFQRTRVMLQMRFSRRLRQTIKPGVFSDLFCEIYVELGNLHCYHFQRKEQILIHKLFVSGNQVNRIIFLYEINCVFSKLYLKYGSICICMYFRGEGGVGVERGINSLLVNKEF